MPQEHLPPPSRRVAGAIQIDAAHLLPGQTTLLNQLEQGVFDFYVQHLLQLLGDIPLAGILNERRQSFHQRAVT